MNIILRLLVLSFLALPQAALADRYRMDLILFLDRYGTGNEAPIRGAAPAVTGTLEASDVAKLRAAGIELLPDDAFGLNNQWQKLRNSKRYQPLVRLAWLQKAPPTERGPSLRLRWGNPDVNATYAVDGSVALLAARYLHLDVDLAYTQPGGNGDPAVYRLHERRRMKRDELHHLDSPKLGLIARAQKIKEP